MGKYLIYGKGKVGRSLAAMCDHIGQPYILCDESDAPATFDEIDLILPSPGLPSSHRVYATDKVISELDFLVPFIPKGFLIHAVTGTDGKSTTAHILYHFLRGGFPDMPVYLGGNIGTPLADIILEIEKKNEKSGHIVIEISSFMSYNIRSFYANNAILTNLHPDHLDWHRDIHEYYNSKLNLLAHTRERVIYPSSVLTVVPELEHFPVKAFPITTPIPVDQNLVTLSSGSMIDLSDRQLFGYHNVENIVFAATLALELGIGVTTLSAILPTITSLPHRLSRVPTTDQKNWIDDSKSTTAQSLFAALRSFAPKKVLLIAGGKDKGDPFTGLASILKEYCSFCATIGETKTHFLQACHESFVPCKAFATLEEAIQYCSENSVSGDTILLSPGCSSFDMFIDYEDRAKHFRKELEAKGIVAL